MRPLSYLMLAALLAAPLQQAVAGEPDTLISIQQPRQVIVTESPDGVTTVMVNGTATNRGYFYTYTSTVGDKASSDGDLINGIDFKMPFKRTGNKKVNFRFMRGLMVGMAWCPDHFGGLKNGWEAMLNEIIGVGWTPARHAPTFAIGLGVGWRKWSLDKNWTLSRNDLGALALHPLSADEKARGSYASTLFNFSWTVPITITQPIYKDFAVQVGALVNFNTYTTASVKLEEPSGAKQNTDIKRLHQRPLTVDVMATIGCRDGLGVYFKYSPMGIFTAPNGPKFKAMSVGVNIAF